MKKLLLLLFLAVMVLSSKAQNEAKTWTIQPKVGLNIANLTNGDGNKVRTGISAGVELEYHLTDMFSLSSGVMYSDLTNKLDYINIPIIANVYVAKGLAVKLGVQPGCNYSAPLYT